MVLARVEKKGNLFVAKLCVAKGNHTVEGFGSIMVEAVKNYSAAAAQCGRLSELLSTQFCQPTPRVCMAMTSVFSESHGDHIGRITLRLPQEITCASPERYIDFQNASSKASLPEADGFSNEPSSCIH